MLLWGISIIYNSEEQWNLVIKRHFVKYFSDYISMCVREEGRDECRREERGLKI